MWKAKAYVGIIRLVKTQCKLRRGETNSNCILFFRSHGLRVAQACSQGYTRPIYHP